MEYDLKGTIQDLINDMYSNQEITPSLAKTLIQSKRLSDKLRLYNIALNDTYFLAKKFDRDSIFDKANWSLTETPDTEYVRERLWSILNNNKLRSIHEAIYKGVSVQEIIYDSTGKVFDIIDIPINLLKYKLDYTTGEHLIYKVDNNRKQTLLDNDKIVVAVSDVFINDLPRGIAESVANLLTLKYITMYKQLARFNESVAIPGLIGKYQTEQQRQDMIVALQNMGTNSRGVIPLECQIDWLEAKNSDTATFINTIELVNSEISRLITGVVNSGEGSVGSYSALESQISIKNDIMSKSFDVVADAINSYLIPAICGEIGSIEWPEFRLNLPNVKNIDQDIKLRELGVKFTKQYIVDNYGLSDTDFDFE